jgi:hypothetical protein
MSEVTGESGAIELPVTAMEVARSIGWLDAFNSDGLEFSSADWSQVPETGVVTLEGRKGDLLVDVKVHIVEVRVSQDDDDSDWLDDEDDEEFCPVCTVGMESAPHDDCEASTPPAPSLWDVHEFNPGYTRMNDECQANNGACLLPRDHATHAPSTSPVGSES